MKVGSCVGHKIALSLYHSQKSKYVLGGAAPRTSIVGTVFTTNERYVPHDATLSSEYNSYIL